MDGLLLFGPHYTILLGKNHVSFFGVSLWHHLIYSQQRSSELISLWYFGVGVIEPLLLFCWFMGRCLLSEAGASAQMQYGYSRCCFELPGFMDSVLDSRMLRALVDTEYWGYLGFAERFGDWLRFLRVISHPSRTAEITILRHFGEYVREKILEYDYDMHSDQTYQGIAFIRLILVHLCPVEVRLLYSLG